MHLLRALQSCAAAEGSPQRHVFERTRALVFFGVPHAGSELADLKWGLGYMIKPAAPIPELLSSPRLSALNEWLAAVPHIESLSFGEALPTLLAPHVPRVVVVKAESADPGFGTFVRVETADHYSICKLDRETDEYQTLLAFIKRSLDR